MSKVISVLNQKGGVGKTTSVINLSAYLAKLDKQVLVIDSDPQANATTGLGVSKASLKTSFYDSISGKLVVDEVILKLSENISLIPADQSIAEAEVNLINQPKREYVFREAISRLRDKYDYILFDCPPSLSLITVNALTASDYVLVPVQAEFYAMEGLSQLLEVMQLIKSGLNPDLELLGVFITMFDSRNSLANQVLTELKNFFGPKLFSTIIPRNVRLAEAPSYGQSILSYDKWSKGARAYKQLANELVKRSS